MSNTDRDFVLQSVGRREILEQIAEEASELAQSALKVIRAEGISDNPTTVSASKAIEDFREELTDVIMCASAVVDINSLNWMDSPKWTRWKKRLQS